MKPGVIATVLSISGIFFLNSPVFSQDPESVSTPPPDSPLGFTAEQHTRRIETNGRIQHSQALVYRAGSVVRFEREETDAAQVTIHDFEKGKEYRVYDTDHMVFEFEIPNLLRAKSYREGLLPYPEDDRIEVMRHRLGTAVWEGHPTEIILQVREIRSRMDPRIKLTEYTLFWEALDLNRQPLRIAYHQTAQILLVVEYLNFKSGPIDTALLTVPEGYMSLTPY